MINESDSDILTFLCQKNFIRNNYDTYIIKFAIKIYKNDLMYLNDHYKLVTDYKLECFQIAVSFCKNINFLKLFIDYYQIDINLIIHDFTHCNYLGLACTYNANPEIIKYFIENYNMDPNCVNTSHDSCLTLACWINPNLCITKYLIEELRMNINHCDKYGIDCFYAAFSNNNIEIIKYLIEDTNVTISIRDEFFDTNKFYEVAKVIKKNQLRLNQFLKIRLEKFSSKDIEFVKNNIDPWILDEDVRKICCIDIFSIEFNILKNNVDRLTFPIFFSNTITIQNVKKEKYFQDYTELPGILFKHNEICYYGYRNIVFNSIILFKEILSDSNFNFNEIIVLNVSAPKYIINLYIDSCYSKTFDINDVEPEHVMEFISLIDQYPTDYLSLYILEDDLTKYIIHHNINCNDYIKDISIRYKLKKLYIVCHNSKFLNS